jgi:DNA-binding response OmpR family regulator
MGSSSEARMRIDTRVLMVATGGEGGARAPSDLDWYTALPDAALRTFYEVRPDVVLIDCPEECARALDLITSVRGFSDLPILAVTGNADAGIHALRAGADSVAPKPISEEEVRLRIGRLLERTGHVREVLGDALVELDRRNHLVVADGRSVELTPTEFRLLAAMMEKAGAVLSHLELLQAAWGDLDCGEDQVKLFVSYLRRSFAATGIDPVETVRGIGYRYRPHRLAEE